MFQTKPQIALSLIDRALANKVLVSAWTFDELYGRDSKFLDGVDARGQAFVAELPSDTRVWTSRPKIIRRGPRKLGKGRPKKTPRVARQSVACEVRNLGRYSSKFQRQSWQRYRIKDTERGPEVWEIKWLKVWRKTEEKLLSKQQTLIVARNVRTGEINCTSHNRLIVQTFPAAGHLQAGSGIGSKYFLSNQVVGRDGVTLRWLLRVAFGRWSIEACFRIAKEELGMDHFEVRGWRCIHRHYYVTALSSLLCNRIRQGLDQDKTEVLTVEQVRRSLNAYLMHRDLPPPLRDAAYEKELADQQYYQERNLQAKKSHTKTRMAFYHQLAINVNKIKSCLTLA